MAVRPRNATISSVAHSTARRGQSSHLPPPRSRHRQTQERGPGLQLTGLIERTGPGRAQPRSGEPRSSEPRSGAAREYTDDRIPLPDFGPRTITPPHVSAPADTGLAVPSCRSRGPLCALPPRFGTGTNRSPGTSASTHGQMTSYWWTHQRRSGFNQVQKVVRPRSSWVGGPGARPHRSTRGRHAGDRPRLTSITAAHEAEGERIPGRRSRRNGVFERNHLQSDLIRILSDHVFVFNHLNKCTRRLAVEHVSDFLRRCSGRSAAAICSRPPAPLSSHQDSLLPPDMDRTINDCHDAGRSATGPLHHPRLGAASASTWTTPSKRVRQRRLPGATARKDPDRAHCRTRTRTPGRGRAGADGRGRGGARRPTTGGIDVIAAIRQKCQQYVLS